MSCHRHSSWSIVFWKCFVVEICCRFVRKLLSVCSKSDIADECLSAKKVEDSEWFSAKKVADGCVSAKKQIVNIRARNCEKMISDTHLWKNTKHEVVKKMNSLSQTQIYNRYSNLSYSIRKKSCEKNDWWNAFMKKWSTHIFLWKKKISEHSQARRTYFCPWKKHSRARIWKINE